jgi:hypothetical protein
MQEHSSNFIFSIEEFTQQLACDDTVSEFADAKEREVHF